VAVVNTAGYTNRFRFTVSTSITSNLSNTAAHRFWLIWLTVARTAIFTKVRSDVGTFSADDAYLIRFFNPRTDSWHDHFDVHEGVLTGKTEIGKSMVRIFQFNDTERLLFRRQLISLDLYSPF